MLSERERADVTLLVIPGPMEKNISERERERMREGREREQETETASE